MTDDKIQDYAGMKLVYRTFFPPFSSCLCKIEFSSKRSKNSDVIKRSVFCDVMLNQNEAGLLFSYLLIAASLCIVLLRKIATKLQRCMAKDNGLA